MDDPLMNSYPPMPILDWLEERLDNCLRIAETKQGADRNGWLDDAEYFRTAIKAITPAPPSAERPNLGELREQPTESVPSVREQLFEATFDLLLKYSVSMPRVTLAQLLTDIAILPIIEQREREAAEEIAKQACHMAENHYGYACLELRNLWDRLAMLKSQPKEGGR